MIGLATEARLLASVARAVHRRRVGADRRSFRVAARLETGMLGLDHGFVSNPEAPFGGVKHSGFGREGGREGIEECLETKYMAIAR